MPDWSRSGTLNKFIYGFSTLETRTRSMKKKTCIANLFVYKQKIQYQINLERTKTTHHKTKRIRNIDINIYETEKVAVLWLVHANYVFVGGNAIIDWNK